MGREKAGRNHNRSPRCSASFVRSQVRLDKTGLTRVSTAALCILYGALAVCRRCCCRRTGPATGRRENKVTGQGGGPPRSETKNVVSFSSRWKLCDKDEWSPVHILPEGYFRGRWTRGGNYQQRPPARFERARAGPSGTCPTHCDCSNPFCAPLCLPMKIYDDSEKRDKRDNVPGKN